MEIVVMAAVMTHSRHNYRETITGFATDLKFDWINHTMIMLSVLH